VQAGIVRTDTAGLDRVVANDIGDCNHTHCSVLKVRLWLMKLGNTRYSHKCYGAAGSGVVFDTASSHTEQVGRGTVFGFRTIALALRDPPQGMADSQQVDADAWPSPQLETSKWVLGGRWKWELLLYVGLGIGFSPISCYEHPKLARTRKAHVEIREQARKAFAAQGRPWFQKLRYPT